MSRYRPPAWFVLLLPAIIILAAVVLVPLILSFYSSFTPYKLTRPETPSVPRTLIPVRRRPRVL